MHIRLAEFRKQFAMGGERIFEFEFHFVAREGTVPAIGVVNANADDEVIEVRDDSGQLFAIGQSDGGEDRFRPRIKHMRFQFNGRVFVGDAGEIAGGRVTILTAPGAFKEGFSFIRVAGEKFVRRVIGGNLRGFQRGLGASVEEGSDVGNLVGGQGKRRHAFVHTTVADHFADEFAFLVVGDERGAHQIGAAGAGGVGTMAEAAGLQKLLAAAVNGRELFGGRTGRATFLCGGVSNGEGKSEQGDDDGREKFSHRKIKYGSKSVA